MNPTVFSRLDTILAGVATANPGVVYYPPDEQMDFENHLPTGMPWIKSYPPSEVAGQQVMEEYLVIIDVGATNLETARYVSQKVRNALVRTNRQPNGYRLQRITPLPEQHYWRFQHTYRRTLRPENQES